MSLTTPYFSHDINAVSDFKVSSMVMEFGIEGYGLYWVIIEGMASTKDCRLPLKDSLIRVIAMKCQVDAEVLSGFIERCIDEFELFETDGEFVWSNSLMTRMRKSQDNVARAKKAAKARWSGGKSKTKTKEKPKEKKVVVDVDVRKKKFGESLSQFKDDYDRDMLSNFYNYWSEKGDNDTKMRFEKEKTWNLKARVKRWSSNGFDKKKKDNNNSNNLFNFGN